MTQQALPGVVRGPSAKLRQKAGAIGERIADQMHARCAWTGVALVRRVNSNLRLVSGRGGPQVVPTGKSTVDCWGVLKDGRAVAIEIKSCQDRRLDLDRLPSHQLSELAQVQLFGGLSLVLVIGPGSEAWAVPYDAVSAEILRGARRSMGPEQLAPWACDPRRPYLERWLEQPAANDNREATR